MPDEPEVMGLLALVLLIESRRATRSDNATGRDFLRRSRQALT
jgi:predicted RNA polymerase sigma factor